VWFECIYDPHAKFDIRLDLLVIVIGLISTTLCRLNSVLPDGLERTSMQPDRGCLFVTQADQFVKSLRWPEEIPINP